MDGSIRIGKVSSVNHELGMIKVVYPDRDDAVTKDMPVLNMGGIYNMPGIDDTVLVLHLSNDISSGVVLGTFWSSMNRPEKHGKNVYYNKLGSGAEISYTDGVLKIKAPRVVMEETEGEVT